MKIKLIYKSWNCFFYIFQIKKSKPIFSQISSLIKNVFHIKVFLILKWWKFLSVINAKITFT